MSRHVGTGAAKRSAPQLTHGRKGRRRRAQVLAAAREIFATRGYGALSMRRIAKRLGIRLSSVQHYFANKELLLEAVLADTAESYLKRYESIFQRSRRNARVRLVGLVDFLIEDLKNPTTNGLFFELWAVAQRHRFAARVMDKMYTLHREILGALLRTLNPGLTAKEVALRAALIAAQIEGLMLFLAAGKPRHDELEGLERAARERALELATARPVGQGMSIGRRQPTSEKRARAREAATWSLSATGRTPMPDWGAAMTGPDSGWRKRRTDQ